MVQCREEAKRPTVTGRP